MTLVAGVDIGSSTAKAVVLRQDEILAYSLIPTGPDGPATAHQALELALTEAGLRQKDMEYIVSTGYGRVNVPFAHLNLTEISCHAKGMNWLHPEVRTILDVGGQDSKVIRCNEIGKVTNFVMNDKCAAGTGRYLERIAKTLGVTPERIGAISLEPVHGPLPISSFCAVFAQTDVLTLVRQNKPPADILAGACEAIAERLTSLLGKVGGIEERFAMTGGVAKNMGIVRRLERVYSTSIVLAFEPQVVGALGAALLGKERLSKQ